MNKVNLQMRNGLKAVFITLPSAGLPRVLVYGAHALLHSTFCKLVDVSKAAPRWLACTHVEIFSVDHYPLQAAAFVTWLKDKIPKPPCAVWWTLAEPCQWLRLHVSSQLYCIRLALVDVQYYILVPFSVVEKFRSAAFRKHG